MKAGLRPAVPVGWRWRDAWLWRAPFIGEVDVLEAIRTLGPDSSRKGPGGPGPRAAWCPDPLGSHSGTARGGRGPAGMTVDGQPLIPVEVLRP